MDDLICDVCQAEPALGVASAIAMPISLAYGRNCLQAGIESYGLIVANTASILNSIDDYERDCADWWKALAEHTCDYFGVDRERFFADVQGCIDDFANYMLSQDPETVRAELPTI